ncbi:MAG: methionyl-tRNA formyltransferase [Candidatus Omnitrophica bacterium]|nr:methionyl-tRNA formyltransferase [Candidatus Omnitrophota bacterium]
MKIVFFGSSEFAVDSLSALLNKKYSFVAVITQPDRRKGRNLKLAQTPVKAFALQNNLPVLTPANVNDRRVISELAGFGADLFIVVSFGQILSKQLLAVPELYAVNVHFSLLPRWRGAAPVNYALLHADKNTGVTVIRMNEFMDRGDVITTGNLDIKVQDDAVSLGRKLSALGAQTLLKALDLIEKNKVEFKIQDEARATLAPKLKKEDGLISWDDSAQSVHNKVRAFVPWPCAYTFYKGKLVKVLKTKIIDAQNAEVIFGQVAAIEKQKGILVTAGSGLILIESLQPEGKRAMSAYDFALGQHLKIKDKFGAEKS